MAVSIDTTQRHQVQIVLGVVIIRALVKDTTCIFILARILLVCLMRIILDLKHHLTMIVRAHRQVRPAIIRQLVYTTGHPVGRGIITIYTRSRRRQLEVRAVNIVVIRLDDDIIIIIGIIIFHHLTDIAPTSKTLGMRFASGLFLILRTRIGLVGTEVHRLYAFGRAVITLLGHTSELHHIVVDLSDMRERSTQTGRHTRLVIAPEYCVNSKVAHIVVLLIRIGQVNTRIANGLIIHQITVQQSYRRLVGTPDNSAKALLIITL